MTLQTTLVTFFSGTFCFSFGQSNQTDTTFLLRTNSDGIYHAIFIDPTKASKLYDRISNFTFYNFDQESYDNSLNDLKSNHISLTRKVITQVPKKWIPLYQYRNKFYVYYPCDFYFHFKVSITDTSFIDYTGEGPVANKINDFKKINDTTFKFNLTGIEPNRNLIIHIIEKENDIAVFEENSQEKNKRYYLMISSDNVKNVPMIVNYCPTRKEMEFEFDKPNYSKLLEAK